MSNNYNLIFDDKKPNCPFYLYRMPMFAITVSTVLLVENGIIVIDDNNLLRFPSGMVKAGQETIQFAAVRIIKELIGINIIKDTLIPVDFRSDPERSDEKNIVDLGFLCITYNKSPEEIVENTKNDNVKWKPVDFEKKCLLIKDKQFYSDHHLLMERALEVVYMMRE